MSIRDRPIVELLVGGMCAVILVGLLTATWPLAGVGLVVAGLGLGLLRWWPDAVPVLSIALLYSNAFVIFAQRGTIPTSAAALLLAGLALTAMRSAWRTRHLPGPPPSFCLVLVFAGVQCLSALVSVAPQVAQAEVFASLSEGITLFLLVSYAIIETRTLRSVVDALVLVGAALGALSVIQHVTGDYTNTFYGFAGISNASIPGSVSASAADLQPRLNGNIGETNRYGQILAVLLPLAAARFAIAKTWWLRILLVVAGALMLGAIVYTYSRGTAVALAGVLITLTAMRWIRPRWLVGALVAGLVVGLATPGYSDRLASLTSIAGATALEGSDSAADNAVRGRATEIISALYVFADHPVLGVGPGVFPTVYPQYAAEVGIRPRLEEREAHNLYAGTAAETGLLGLVALLLIFWRLLSGLVRAARAWEAVDRTRALLARGFFTAVLLYAYTGMFLHLSYVRYFWLMIGLAAAAARLPDQRPWAIPVPRRFQRRRRAAEATRV